MKYERSKMYSSFKSSISHYQKNDIYLPDARWQNSQTWRILWTIDLHWNDISGISIRCVVSRLYQLQMAYLSHLVQMYVFFSNCTHVQHDVHLSIPTDFKQYYWTSCRVFHWYAVYPWYMLCIIFYWSRENKVSIKRYTNYCGCHYLFWWRLWMISTFDQTCLHLLLFTRGVLFSSPFLSINQKILKRSWNFCERSSMRF